PLATVASDPPTKKPGGSLTLIFLEWCCLFGPGSSSIQSQPSLSSTPGEIFALSGRREPESSNLNGSPAAGGRMRAPFQGQEPEEISRARLAALVESSDDVIVSKTLDGIITSWNPAAEHLFGWTAAEAVGNHITLIVPANRRAEEDDVLMRLGRGERIDHFETVRQAKDGRLIDMSITVSPIRDGTGRVVGASKIGRDISERRRLEDQRAE